MDKDEIDNMPQIELTKPDALNLLTHFDTCVLSTKALRKKNDYLRWRTTARHHSQNPTKACVSPT